MEWVKLFLLVKKYWLSILVSLLIAGAVWYVMDLRSDLKEMTHRRDNLSAEVTKIHEEFKAFAAQSEAHEKAITESIKKERERNEQKEKVKKATSKLTEKGNGPVSPVLGPEFFIRLRG